MAEMPETLDGELVSYEKLAGIARDGAAGYAGASPFPHIVIDGLFSDDVLRAVLDEFPGPHEIDWKKYRRAAEVKLGLRDESQLGPRTRRFIQELNSGRFLRCLSDLSGIDALLPDPYLEGAGLHQIMPGGKLAVHVDLPKGRLVNLDRRLNMIVYLNQGWRDEYAGDLQFWNADATQCVRRIAPVFNRTVIFTTTGISYHGHPEPLRCPPDQTRKSLALFYFTNGRPADELVARAAVRYRFPGQGRKLLQIKELISQFVPPIVWDIRAELHHRLVRARSMRDRD